MVVLVMMVNARAHVFSWRGAEMTLLPTWTDLMTCVSIPQGSILKT